MKYNLIKDLIELVEAFEAEESACDIDNFKKWIYQKQLEKEKYDAHLSQIVWEGKDKGRSIDSVINTLIVHMNRYAKSYSKAAMLHSDFSTQDEFIFLIQLRAFGAMSKMELIKKNVHDKTTGIQIINRLIKNGWVSQVNSNKDKRTKVLAITEAGALVLERQMDNIRKATSIVTGNLTESEKYQLAYLLDKLDHFHKPIYSEYQLSDHILDDIIKKYKT